MSTMYHKVSCSSDHGCNFYKPFRFASTNHSPIFWVPRFIDVPYLVPILILLLVKKNGSIPKLFLSSANKGGCSWFFFIPCSLKTVVDIPSGFISLPGPFRHLDTQTIQACVRRAGQTRWSLQLALHSGGPSLWSFKDHHSMRPKLEVSCALLCIFISKNRQQRWPYSHTKTPVYWLKASFHKKTIMYRNAHT